MKKQIISGIITAGLALSLSVPVLALELTIKDSVSSQQAIPQQTSTVSFRDIPSTHWAYGAISEMTAKGLFGGKVVYDDSTALFAPDDTMTRAEFTVVVVRALYKSELDAMPAVSLWWSNAYKVALDKGILKSNELDNGNMDKGMSRQEMALVLVRAAEQKGESASQLVPTSKIADYNTVGTYYRDSVVKAFSMGMLAGTDAKGTYNPQATMNRAQGAAVLNRLVDSSSRIKVDFSTPSEAPVAGVQTIKEGQISERLPAKEGDIFIKADGTKITLKKDANGVLGGGQGVAPDLGMQYGDSAVKNGVIWHYDGSKSSQGKDVTLYDSLGNKIQNQTYYVNKTTGEGYWGTTWTYLQKKFPAPSSKGSYDGELSKDSYSLYSWFSAADIWALNK